MVFTLPEEIAAIAYQNKAVVYEILFHAAAETLHTIAAEPKHLGAEIGFIAIFHIWGQNLLPSSRLRSLRIRTLRLVGQRTDRPRVEGSN